ncbi:hypothetical protein TraAM80_00447 [Trypanosoma rangeli]|uniref:Uncharacterized protein n=1 Tax=Trypanosoma rangeli TaxID=5698 RepID=A0A422P358_TRYRA|nr:uncharacterized protein TraAM80_00447 [Trypanosoma rangeli]RNF12166.1 hypothetical protein TraAM80_00447 [Trypanosoma rangeli]|eukprot:RNF12166.1 hypothetical protein TraAM80_00447 [Trypanosoma rangeli]
MASAAFTRATTIFVSNCCHYAVYGVTVFPQIVDSSSSSLASTVRHDKPKHRNRNCKCALGHTIGTINDIKFTRLRPFWSRCQKKARAVAVIHPSLARSLHTCHR